MMKSIIISLLLVSLFGFKTSEISSTDVCLSGEEQKLYLMIMDYRKSKGLEAIPLSAKLTLVAQTHAQDLTENYTFASNNVCNPHSWSKKGKWSSCCYTNDHKEKECMWNKPKEIAGYASSGYEIAYYSSRGATAEEGLAGWKVSAGHNPVIVNDGIWKKVKWNAIGIGIRGEYGVVWFGELADSSPIGNCNAQQSTDAVDN